MISVTDNPNPVTGASLTYRSAANFNNSWNWNIHYRAALSYITGSHSFKVGFNNAYGHHDNTNYASPSMPFSYNFANGVPNAIVYRIVPRTVEVNVDRDLGLFVQDRWTTGRLTLSGGLRYDSFKNSFPPQAIAGTYFGRTLDIQFDTIQNLNWQDVTPKLGATYDLFGTGRTALKVTLNKYLEGLGTTGSLSDPPNPINRLNTQTQRTWTDVDRDFVPDCDLNNFDANGECLALANAATFGTITPGTTYDPNMLEGWGKRGFNWEFTTSVQHEIVPRLSAEVQYARRWYGNFRVNDDLAVTAADYDRFTIAIPSDARLPDGGGYTVTGFDPKPETATRAQNIFVTLADEYGKQTERFDGINVTLNARLQNGVIVQGGLGTGRVVTNDCDIVDDLPETLHQFIGNNQRGTGFFFAARPLERCQQNNGWRTQVQGLATYTIPKIDVQVAATFQNLPGAAVSANANVGLPPLTSNTLGRPFTAAPFRAFNIVDAGELYVERLNQLDFRVGKLFRFNNTRTNINFDFYNVTNSNSVIGENATFGATWRTPQSILLPRLFKISAQFDF
jgi:hypothetical protein